MHKKVTHDYAIKCAQLAKEAGVKHVLLLSAVGVSTTSWFAWGRLKADVEEQIKSLNFESTSIFQPGMIFAPNRPNKTISEHVADWIFTYLGWLFPEKYQGIQVEDLANAFVKVAESPKPGVTVYQVPEYRKLKKE